MENLEVTVTSASSSLTVRGQWRISVVLPSNRNYKGWLVLYNASGEIIHQYECLGRADSGDATGNTPTGECEAELMGPKTTEKDIASFGPYKYVKLEPLSGDMYEFTHRSLFRIYGGDPSTSTSATWYPLRPTNGCIRVSNDDIYLIQFYITQVSNEEYHDSKGYASITEVTSNTHITSVS